MSLKSRFSSPRIRLIAITTSALLAIASFAVPNAAAMDLTEAAVATPAAGDALPATTPSERVSDCPGFGGGQHHCVFC